MPIKPFTFFKHDCDKCVHLGSFNLWDYSTRTKRDMDLYVCPDAHEPRYSSLIARTSSVPSDYGSSPACMVSPLSPALNYALSLFITKHLQCNGANPKEGTYFKDGKLVLALFDKPTDKQVIT